MVYNVYTCKYMCLNTDTHRSTDTVIHRQALTDRQTDRQTDRHTNTQTDRQTDKQTGTDR